MLFETTIEPVKVRILRVLRFFIILSLLSIIPLIIISFTIGSPTELTLKSEVNQYSKNYIELNNRLDNLQQQLVNGLFVSDKFYREILQADSIPYPVRTAGMGGSEVRFTLYSYSYSGIINSTFKKSEAIKKQVEIQDNSYTQLLNEALTHNKKTRYTPAIKPVKPTTNISVSSSFGVRYDPFTFINKSHDGIDFVGPENTQVFSTADGFVSIAEDNHTGYGKEIVLLHDFGFSTRYAHLNKILISSGQRVKRGQLIGLMGSTGRSTGTHLHYEVRLFNKPLNPYNYFSDDLTEQDYELFN